MGSVSDEQLLDGYRDGLGAAIRAVQRVREGLPQLVEDEHHTMVDRILASIAVALQTISASVVLDNGQVRRDG